MKRHTRKSRCAKREAANEASRKRALRRRVGQRRLVELEARIVSTLQASQDPLARFVRAHPDFEESLRRDEAFRSLCDRVAGEAPRLFCDDYVLPLSFIARLAWIRPVGEWEPQGKGRWTLFRSLSAHLFARYPTPEVVWSLLLRQDAPRWAPIVTQVGQGRSLFQLVKAERVPLLLTKKQCHLVLWGRIAADFFTAVRAAQFLEWGCRDRRLLAAWLRSDIGGPLVDLADETFFLSFVRLCARSSDFQVDSFGPLLDYIKARRRDDAQFSLKGRTIQSLRRGMLAWQEELHRECVVRHELPANFPQSGFRELVHHVSVRHKGIPHALKRTWRLFEIRTPTQLLLEGKKQRHCVLTYGHEIARGKASIWSLTLNEGWGAERTVTLEVRNASKRVVQIRGLQNRRAKKNEMLVIARWASQNGLDVAPDA